MKVSVSTTERRFNYATRRHDVYEVECGGFTVDSKTETAIKRLAQEYRASFADMVQIALSYYFGDGQNHLQCEYCDLWRDCSCLVPSVGGQTALPLLDKGSVVVGLSTDDQGL